MLGYCYNFMLSWSAPFSLFRWNLDGYFSSSEVDRRLDWQARGCLLSPTPNIILLLPFLFIISTCFNMSWLMGAMSIEWIETRVESSSSDIPFSEHVEISWTPDYVLSMLCFNGNINSSCYFRICTRSSLNSEFQMEIPFYSFSIADLWETIGSPSKYLGVMVSESKTILHIILLTFHLWTSHIPMFKYVLSGSVTPRYHRSKVEAVSGVPTI